MAQKDDLGAAGEAHAREWLTARGWQIVEHNWHCQIGEVDVVARRGSDLVFFEVKTRSTVRFGHPVEAISATKLARMRRVAGQWLNENPGHRGRIRLDLIAILGRPGTFTVEHVEALG